LPFAFFTFLVHLSSQKRWDVEAVVVFLAELNRGLFQRRRLALFAAFAASIEWMSFPLD
jgi:hypothetical protein